MGRLAIWPAATFAGAVLSMACVLTIDDQLMQRWAVGVSLLLTGCAAAKFSELRTSRERERLRHMKLPELKSAEPQLQKLYKLNQRMWESTSFDLLGSLFNWVLIGAAILWMVYYPSRDSALLAWATGGYMTGGVLGLFPSLRKRR